jgi:hypothetical protein
LLADHRIVAAGSRIANWWGASFLGAGITHLFLARNATPALQIRYLKWSIPAWALMTMIGLRFRDDTIVPPLYCGVALAGATALVLTDDSEKHL